MKELSGGRGCFQDNLLKLIAESRIIPIIDAVKPDQLERLVALYYQAGFRTLEMKMDSRFMEAFVNIARRDYPEIYLLAGTCRSPRDIRRASFLGMDITISPVFDPELIKYACLHSIPYIPAVSNTEMLGQVITLGFSVVKFYPAEQKGGASFIGGLYPDYDVRIMATGGITLDKIPEYLALDNVAAVCTSHIVSPRLMLDNNWAEIEKRVKTAEGLLKESKG